MTNDIYTGTETKEIDRIAISEFGYAGFELMTVAGQKAFQCLVEKFTEPASILVLCGTGNNGGDGYIVAGCALTIGWNVELVAIGSPKTDDAITASRFFIESGGTINDSGYDLEKKDYDVVVDALLGVGISGSPHGAVAQLLEKVNQLDAFKFAIDVPSGVDADTGNLYSPHFIADQTITFIAPKVGLLTGRAKNVVGDLINESLNLDTQIYSNVPACAVLVKPPTIPKRQIDSHKGHFGNVAVVGGDNGMLGAVLLAGRAALRTGSGKVTVISTDSHLDQPALYTPELMSAVFDTTSAHQSNRELLMPFTATALGPGLGMNSWGETVFHETISLLTPLVIDADAITHLAGTALSSPSVNWVLTPHPGEAATLLECDSNDIQADRLSAAKEIARQRNAICVLKGAGTVIADPDGQISICDLGNSGMATAGMGDVLSGMTAALIGQGFALREAAEAAVWLHAYTADQIVSVGCEMSLLASDIIDQLAVSISQLNSQDFAE